MTTTWMTRCENGKLWDEFREGGFIATGDIEMQPDLTGVSSKDEIKSLMRQAKHSRAANLRKLGYAAGVMYRMAIGISVGDRVFTYDRKNNRCCCGTVTRAYRFDPHRIAGKQHYRPVKWGRAFPLDALSTEARSSFRAQASVFRLPDATGTELQRLAPGN